MSRHLSRLLRIVFPFAVLLGAVGPGWAGPPLPATSVWLEDPADIPVIDRGAVGSWDHVAVDNPFVFREDGIYYCFFEAENAARQEQVGLAVSRDLRQWRKWEGNPVLSAGPPGSWDHLAAKLPVVGKHGDTYIMLYTGKDGKGHAGIGLATSTDLRHWQKSGDGPAVPGREGSWDPIVTTCPALGRAGGEYRLLYRGMTGFYTGQQLGLLTSPDLQHWTRREPPLDGLAGINSFAVGPSPDGQGFLALSQRSTADRFFASDDFTVWSPGPAARFHPGPIDTPSNPFPADGSLWILYEKADRIFRARLVEAEPEGPPAATVPLPFSDRFDDPERTRASLWAPAGHWTTEGGALRQSGTGPDWALNLVATEALPAAEVEAVARHRGGGGWVGLCAAHATGYYTFAVVFDGRDIARVFRTSTGVWGEVDLARDVPFRAVADRDLTLSLTVKDGVVTGAIDGRVVIRVVDPDPLPPGRAGLFTTAAAAEFTRLRVSGP